MPTIQCAENKSIIEEIAILSFAFDTFGVRIQPLKQATYLPNAHTKNLGMASAQVAT